MEIFPALICHVERLAPVYVEKWTHFSLNVIPTFVGGTIPDKLEDYLQPWTWTWDDSVSVVGIVGTDNGTRLIPLTAQLLKSPQPEISADERTALVQSIKEREWEACRAQSRGNNDQINPFVWQHFDPDSVNENAFQEIELVQDGKPFHDWRHYLANLSVKSPILGRELGMARFFKLNNTEVQEVLRQNGLSETSRFEAVLAAPGFAGGFGKPKDVQGLRNYSKGILEARRQPGSDRLLYEWRYETSNVRAYFEKCEWRPVQPAERDGGWILPDNQSTLGEDWASKLENRITDAFDMAALLLGVLRNRVQPLVSLELDKTTDEQTFKTADAEKVAPEGLDALKFIQKWHSPFLIALLDLIHIGDRPGPDGASLKSMVFDIWLENLGGLRSKIETRFNEVKDETFDRELSSRSELNVYRQGSDDNASLLNCYLNMVIPKEEADPPATPARREFVPSVDWDLAELQRSASGVKSPETIRNTTKIIKTIRDYLDRCEMLHSYLMDPACVDEIIFLRWTFKLDLKDRFTKRDWESRFTSAEEFQDALKEVLKKVQPRRRMLAANLKPGWDSMQANNLHKPGMLQDELLNAFKNYFDGRFGLSQNAYSTFLPHLIAHKDLQEEFESYLGDENQGFVRDLVNTQLLPLELRQNDSISNPPERLPVVSEGIAFRVASLARYDSNTNLGSTDPLRHMSGIMVFLREVFSTGTKGNWSCLNWVQLSIPKPSAKMPSLASAATDRESEKYLLLPTVMAQPVQLSYVNDLRQAYIHYDGHPLAAPSKALGLSQANIEEQNKWDLDASLEVFRFNNPYGKDGAVGTLPGLKFGVEYQAVCVAVGPAGNLPAELVDGTENPGALKVEKLGEVPDARLFKHKYLRRVAPGQVRVYRPREDKDVLKISDAKLVLPPIPDTVNPMARSLGVENTDRENTDCPIILLVDPTTKDEWKPGVLQNHTHCTFNIRPPAVDLQTWDRWVAGADGGLLGIGTDSETIKKGRAQVWGRFHQAVESQQKNNAQDQKSDLTLNDPAVNGFYLHLRRLDADSRDSYSSEVIEFKQLLDSSSVSGDWKNKDWWTLAQLIEVTVSIKAVASSAKPKIDSQKNGSNVDIEVPAGQVWRLEISSAIKNSDDQKFHETCARSRSKLPAPAGWSLYSPATFAIEVAQSPHTAGNHPLSRDEIAVGLRRAFNVRASGDGNSFDVVLESSAAPDALMDGKATAASLLCRSAYRIEILVQKWQWYGRPIPGLKNGEITQCFDYDEFFKTYQNTNVWDAALFGEREDDDYLVLPAVIDTVAHSRKKENAADGQKENKWPWVVFTRPSADDKGVLYYRFAFKVWSRYEGLLNNAFIGDTRFDSSQKNEYWHRLVLLCRYKKELPPPRLKLLVPLTEAIDTDVTPGLLAVFGEPWHEFGGLAEELKVEVMQTSVFKADTNGDTEKAAERMEAGPDPLYNLDVLADGPTAFSNLSVRGPIGYTFDAGTSAPLFSSSAFLIQPPQKINVIRNLDGSVNEEQDLSWWFLKLKFQRVIPGSAFQSGNGLASEWTQPVWAQFLPPSSRFDCASAGAPHPCDTVLTKDLKLIRNSGQYQIVCRDSNQPLRLFDKGSSRRIDTDSASKGYFELYAVLTMPLTDAFGRSEPGRRPEKYLGVYQLNDQSVLTPVDHSSPGEGAIARLIEVQWSERPDFSNNSLWDCLFPGARSIEGISDQDAIGRIVRVSAPIS